MPNTFYKSTRPDGTDFRSGTVLYEAGQTVHHPCSKRFSDMHPNDPSTYLSVSVEPGEVLTGGSWPCRVFSVEPVGRTVKRTDGRYPHKRGCRALRVVEELPAHVALGPNGEQVASVIDRIGRLSVDEAQALYVARDAARYAAWDAARAAARAAAWTAAWDAAWDAARAAARVAAWAAARDAAGSATWAAARAAVWGAVGAAVGAVLVRDLITPDQFDVLYGPWRKVVGH